VTAGLSPGSLRPGVNVDGAPGSLNGGRHAVSHALRDEIAAAVRKASAAGAFAKTDIVKAFIGRANPSTLFGHVKAACDALDIVTIKPPRLARNRAMDEQLAAIEANANAVIERVDHMPADAPIDVERELYTGIADMNILIREAKTDDGRHSRNPRLLATATDLKGRFIERLSRVRADLSDRSQIGMYLSALQDAVLTECPPDVRMRVLNRIRAVNSSWGVDG
jgi:hypothetical protein